MGEVVHHAMRDYAKGYPFTSSLVYLHQTVDGIIECRVASHNDYCLIAIVDKHLHQPFHTFLVLTLHKVVVDMLLAQHLLYLEPAFSFTPPVTGAIEQSPLVFINRHDLYFVFYISRFTCPHRLSARISVPPYLPWAARRPPNVW